jgi:hypothetical protein
VKSSQRLLSSEVFKIVFENVFFNHFSLLKWNFRI